MNPFEEAWDLVKYEPSCEECGVEITDGKQYGCEQCGRDFCEECLMDDQYGHTGFRGEVDKDHPAYDHLDGAHCGECATQIAEDAKAEAEYEAQDAEEQRRYEAEEAEMDHEAFIENLPEEQKKLYYANQISEMLGIEPPNPFSNQSFTEFTDEWKSEDAFDQAWDEIQKAILPDIDPRIISVLRPNYNLMYSDAGPIQHDIRMRVKDAIPVVEGNIDKLGKLRNRRYDQWPRVVESDYDPNDPYYADEDPERYTYDDARSGSKVIEDLLRETDPNDGNLDLFDHPEHIEQRRIARHGSGHAASWIPFQQAIAPRYLEYLLDKEKEKGGDYRVAVGTGSADLSGKVGNMNLMPGMGGQGIGPHLLGSMLETYGRIGDNTYSPEAYEMWNKLGEKMTEGGIGRRMTINRPHWGSGDRPDTVDHIIRRTNPAGDMIFQRPVFSRKGYFNEPKSWQMKGTKWSGPDAHPYSFSRIPEAGAFKGAKRRTNPSLFLSFANSLAH